MKNTWKAIILVSIQLVCYIDTSALAENICTHFNPCKNLADCYRRDDDPSRVRCACNRGFNGNLCEICNKKNIRTIVEKLVLNISPYFKGQETAEPTFV
jgi:hypothetical protein